MSDNSDSTNERRITLGKIISYPVGALLLLTGLSVLIVGSFLSGLLIILSGALSLPIVRSKLKQNQGISLSRWATVAIVFTLVIAGGATMGDIGSDSDQPMETTEPTEEQDSADTSESSSSSDSSPSDTSTDSDSTQDNINSPPEELLPTIDDFDAGWTGGSSSDDPSQVTFVNTETDTFVTYNVSVHDSVEEASSELESRRPDATSTDDTSVGQEGFLYKPGERYVIIQFRHENVVGKVEYSGGNVLFPENNAANQARRLETSIQEGAN